MSGGGDGDGDGGGEGDGDGGDGVGDGGGGDHVGTVDVCPPVEQQGDNGCVSVIGREHERRVVVLHHERCFDGDGDLLVVMVIEIDCRWVVVMCISDVTL